MRRDFKDAICMNAFSIQKVFYSTFQDQFPFFCRSGCVSGGFQNATTALMGKSPNVTLESLRKGHRHENDFLLLFLFLNLIVTI